MKNYLLILAFTFTLFSCEKKNDQNDDIDKVDLFLDKYNGVVWLGDESTADDSYYLAFYKNPGSFNSWETDQDGSYCFPTIFGQADTFGQIVTVMEENEATLLLSVMDEDSAISSVKITVLDQGSNLKTEIIESNGDRDLDYWTRSTSLDPCK